MNMEGSRFQRSGFSNSNPTSNAFLNLGNGKLVGQVRPDYRNDTDLRLDSISTSFPNHLPVLKGIKRKWSECNGSMVPEDGFSLALGLGRPQSSSDSKGSSGTACTSMSSPKETEEESSIDLNLDFDLHLGTDKVGSTSKSAGVIPKGEELHKFDLELSLSTGPAESDVTSISLGSTIRQTNIGVSKIAESASSHWKLGNIDPPSHSLPSKGVGYMIKQIPGITHMVPSVQAFSQTIVAAPKSSVTCISGLSQAQQRSSSSNLKTCQFTGCGKGARGASGLCISHGGGRRCQKAGCHKGAEGRTVYCKAHGGGRRCQHLGCTKSAEGRTDFCIAHGGGRRCSHEGCSRAARGRSGLCIRHGGGKRCQKENCTKSAEGFSGLCISHGGGRRCQFPECTKGAQGSTMFCKAHGGGKRCTVPGCTKGAEGSTPFCKGHGGGKRCSFEGGGICPKSVHGGTLFCVAHGGGKRCAVPDCTKSARGRTDFCVRHGGGKRCKVDGCGKSAQGSTDFCKAHGGGKRCSWGQPGSGLGIHAATPCDRFARGKTGLCASHSALVQDKRVHGGGTLGSAIQDPKPTKPEKMKGVASVADMHIDAQDNIADLNGDGSTRYRHQGLSLKFMPPVHQPISSNAGMPSSSVPVSEGRVHGGSLMAMLRGYAGQNHNQ